MVFLKLCANHKSSILKIIITKIYNKIILAPKKGEFVRGGGGGGYLRAGLNRQQDVPPQSKAGSQGMASLQPPTLEEEGGQSNPTSKPKQGLDEMWNILVNILRTDLGRENVALYKDIE